MNFGLFNAIFFKFTKKKIKLKKKVTLGEYDYQIISGRKKKFAHANFALPPLQFTPLKRPKLAIFENHKNPVKTLKMGLF